MLLREVLYPFRVAEAPGCLPSNGMPCSASPEDNFERNGGVPSDIGDKTVFSSLCGAERGAIAELRVLAMDGTFVSPVELSLGIFLSWVSSMIFKANSIDALSELLFINAGIC